MEALIELLQLLVYLLPSKDLVDDSADFVVRGAFLLKLHSQLR